MERRKKQRLSVEFVLNSSNGKFTFPNNNELNNKTVVGICLEDNADDELVSQSGRAIISNAAVNSCHMTIMRNSVNLELTIPLKFYQNTNGDREIRDLYVEGFNPATSYIQFQKDPTTGNYRYLETQSIEMTIEYYD